MPIYEYQCDNCHHVTEAWQSLAEEPLTTCQACAGALKKLISMSSFHLKGGGWYADGYSGANDDKSTTKTESCQAKTCSDSCPTKTAPESISTTENKPTCGQEACCNI